MDLSTEYLTILVYDTALFANTTPQVTQYRIPEDTFSATPL